ncbi:hypothetical protein SeMB42_g00111 [Synchytrium endobioticum]|uniref:type I protein arginine methyltransferase n=1 Tax=Synchytrium endobioticum TaxID=286115 RepID=A0A507DU94_9FUNG|nr:hypothetical protein SeLEV6574_g00203 [Synchytrium endobioticum]TPX54852.1 hypothetical protein SeMB42_g00111 [Synchytrium endobioticum]
MTIELIASSSNELEEEDNEDLDESFEGWEDENATEDALCLFCSSMTAKPDLILEHCRVKHGFDLRLVKQALDLDLYGVIKLVNYVRSRAQENPQLLIHDFSETLIPSAEWLQGDKYLKPVIDGDAMLYALDDDDDAYGEETRPFTSSNTDAEVPSAIIAQRRLSNVSMTEATSVLQAALVDAQKRTEAAEARAKDVLNAWKVYREEVTTTILRADRDTLAGPSDEVDYYFGSYAENDIHESMLKDKIRTEAYRDFMYSNKDLFKDKVVLDIGCGTGILSMFAARAGAKKVFAVDNSPIIERAKLIVAENELDGVITCVRGKAEELELPVDSVDIIISEWMGYFLLFEGMLDSVIKARDRWLKPGGLMVPNVAKMYLAGIEDEEFVNDKYHFWNDVYGFKMSAMKLSFFGNAHVEICHPETIVTSTSLFKEFDLNTVTCKSLDFISCFILTPARSSRIHAFLGWFDVDFISPSSHGNSITLSTSPSSDPTHWKQCLFALDRPMDLEQNIEGEIVVRKRESNARELDVIFKISRGSDMEEIVYTVR